MFIASQKALNPTPFNSTQDFNRIPRELFIIMLVFFLKRCMEITIQIEILITDRVYMKEECNGSITGKSIQGMG